MDRTSGSVGGSGGSYRERRSCTEDGQNERGEDHQDHDEGVFDDYDEGGFPGEGSFPEVDVGEGKSFWQFESEGPQVHNGGNIDHGQRQWFVEEDERHHDGIDDNCDAGPDHDVGA